jgi:hypothetical protein
LTVWLALSGAAQAASEIHLQFDFIRRTLAEQLFTQEGKYYARGKPGERCNFAYLANPQVSGSGSRLRITARFSGRSALDLFNRCIGLGDDFDVTIEATPIYKAGALAFKDVAVTVSRDSYYIRRVRQALQQSFAEKFQYKIRDEAKKLLEQSPANRTQEVPRFDVTEVRVGQGVLILVVDFQLTVK